MEQAQAGQPEERAKATARGTRPRSHKTEALVLRSVPVLEADRLITVLTPAMGKLRATVRGARKITSRLGGHLDVLNRTTLSLAEGRTFFVVTGAEVLETFATLKKDLDLMALGFYLMELADALVPEGPPHPAVYHLLIDSLHRMDVNGTNPVIPRYVELQTLSEAGYLPELTRCLVCGKEAPPAPHWYSAGLGGLVCNDCAPTQADVLPLSLDALKVLRFFASSGLGEACRLRLPGSLGKELEAVLGVSVRHVLERELGTSSFLEHLRQLGTGSSRPLPERASKD